ncbi:MULTISPECIES: hypothetical protein [Clostridium]|uniref:hypothetical protein n=1 Tax=Clostridium TaxID=1485 RepID=UPI001C9B0B85|nr:MULTISPECIES: hypothetical protein [Clostridium]MBY7024163.1 hypothetical protein [Clostridium botulinum]
MAFSFGGLVSAIVGAVAKVANAVVSAVKSIVSGTVSSVAGGIEKATSGAMATLGVVDVDEDGELDIDDAEEFFEEKFKLLVGASTQGMKNLASHPEYTALAAGGFAFGVIGLVGSGIGEVFSGGSASPAVIPLATFSTNSIVSSSSDLKAIFTGEYKEKGKFNPLKSAFEVTGEKFGQGIDNVFDSNDCEKVGKDIGGWIFEGADAFIGAKGVKSGVKKIADESYHFKEVTSIGNKIIPTISVPVNNVSKAEKIGAGMDISNTIAGWIDKIFSNDD